MKRVSAQNKVSTKTIKSKSVNSIYSLVPSINGDYSSNLPSEVDNSTSEYTKNYFPPVGNQGGLGSCASFSTTYYTMTYMTAMARNINIYSDDVYKNIFSPKWTYNFINSGKNSGSHIVDAYKLFLNHGAAFWREYEYDDNYTEWCRDPEIWKKAISYRMKETGYIDIGMVNELTPVTSNKDSDLILIKQEILNGKLLNISTDIASWNIKKITHLEDDYYENKFEGQYACSSQTFDGDNRGYHAMTIVGYNDDIWIDINGNGSEETGERGAFKIVNSWDKTWGESNGGFIWVAYDATNKVSSVNPAPVTSERRESIFNYEENGNSANRAYWITANSTPHKSKLIGQFKISHAKRGQLKLAIGYSPINELNPVKYLDNYPNIVNNKNSLEDKLISFDGTTSPSDCEFVLDFTDLINQENIQDIRNYRWYIQVSDEWNDCYPATLKSFKLIDGNGAEILSPDSFDYVVDGGYTFSSAYVNNSTLIQPVKINSINTDKISPQMAKTPIKFTVNAQGGQNLQYRFLVDDVEVSGYGASNTFDWIPPYPKDFKIKVQVKDSNSSRPYDAQNEIDYTTTPIPYEFFTDKFESKNFLTGDWENNGCTITSTDLMNSIYSAQFKGNASLVKDLYSTGYGGVKIKFAFKTLPSDVAKHFIAEWSTDGFIWNNIFDFAGDLSWTTRVIELPAECDNNVNLKIRFRTTGYASTDVAYIDNISISALYVAPTVTTDTPLQNILATGVNVGGEVTTEDPYAIIERGIEYSKSKDFKDSYNKVTVSGMNGQFRASLNNLVPNTSYYARVYAINRGGKGYSNAIGFTTKNNLFYDGFESNDYITGNWNVSETTMDNMERYNNSRFGARIVGNNFIERSIRTTGKNNIRISYARKMMFFETKSKFICEWFDGQNWSAVEEVTTTDNKWSYRTFNLPLAASDNPEFKIRFRTEIPDCIDYVVIDEVTVDGDSFSGSHTVFKDGFENVSYLENGSKYNGPFEGILKPWKYIYHSGGHSALVNSLNSITAPVNTGEYTNYELSFAYKGLTDGFGDTLNVEWYDGDKWSAIGAISVRDDGWHVMNYEISLVENKTDCKIRFVPNFSELSEQIFIDDVVIKAGTPTNIFNEYFHSVDLNQGGWVLTGAPSVCSYSGSNVCILYDQEAITKSINLSGYKNAELSLTYALEVDILSVSV